MAEKFTKGDILVYGNYGLCRMEGIKNTSFVSGVPKQDYYTLTPLSKSASTYYVPVGNEKAVSKLRFPLSEEQIKGILEESKKADIHWIENRQLRSDTFSGILQRGVSPELVALVTCFHFREEALSEQGKTISTTDEMIFTSARELLFEEISYGLGIEKDKAEEYIAAFLS